MSPAAQAAIHGLIKEWRAEAEEKLLRNNEVCRHWPDWPDPSCLQIDADLLCRVAAQLEDRCLAHEQELPRDE